MKRLFILLLVSLLTSTVMGQDGIDLTPPEFGDFDPDSIADIDLTDYPILPEMTDHAREIFERGQESGRNPAMFSKVGDSMTASESFLTAFAGDDYDLGEFTDVQPLIDFINEGSASEDDDTTAFNRVNYATELGFSTITALDPTWAIAEVCEANETPLACEYRVSNSAFALVMFGTNDVLYFDEATFDYYLRLVILETINADVVPVMITFPIRPEAPDLTFTFNKIIVSIAQDYDLPLINLVSALEDLPDSGVDLEDPLHLTVPDAEAGHVGEFTEETLQAGYTMRNLVTLQALHVLLSDLELLPIENDEEA